MQGLSLPMLGQCLRLEQGSHSYKNKDGDLGVPSAAPYAANGYVPEALLRKLVVDLAILESRCFPQVYSVIRDSEGNSGLLPVPLMEKI